MLWRYIIKQIPSSATTINDQKYKVKINLDIKSRYLLNRQNYFDGALIQIRFRVNCLQLQVVILTMKKCLALLLVMAWLICSAEMAASDCTPFGMRIALGRSYWSKKENETVSIWFNTGLQCARSYVTIENTALIRKVSCLTNKLTFGTYSTWVHRCSVDSVPKGGNFAYMAFGWTGNPIDPIIPARGVNYQVHLIGDGQTAEIVSIGDWGYLNVRAGEYDRLDDAFDALLKTKKNYILYLGGDYAYDLSSKKGKNYEQFITMLSQVGSVWPCILAPGNHEYNTVNDFMLYTQSFEIYDITKTNVTKIDLGVFTLIIYQPYGVVFENATTGALLNELQVVLESVPRSQPIITASHYPLACSGDSSHCKKERIVLKEFFNMMIDYNVVMYLGAHYHTYERIVPYLKTGEFSIIPSPYIHTKQTKFLPSIVEGIAGNDKSIVETYTNIQNFTAGLSYNQTGFGIMKVTKSQLSYQHYTAIKWNIPVDSMVIKYDRMLGKQSMNLRKE